MSGSRFAAAVLAVVLTGACTGGDGDGEARAASGWSLDARVGSAGAGIDFCEEAMAGVTEFMSRFEGQAPPSERHGGTVVVGAGGEIGNGMNGHVVAEDQASQHQSFVNLMTLIQYDDDFNPVPYLAESWEVSEDETELTFHLRDDVYWHDGELTDAYDVAYTFRRAVDPLTAFPNSAFWTLYDRGEGGVEVIDSFTVRFHLRPHADFLDPWRTTAIMPEHLLRDVPSAEVRQHPFGTVCPVGNGPFIFVEHRQDASWTFQANPAFPEGLGGRPFLDRYVYRKISDQNTSLTELLTENIDVLVAPRPAQVQAIVDSDALDLSSSPGRMFVFVVWNARRPQLADKRVRQAITKATNRQEIVDAVLLGHGTLANGSIPPFHWASDASVGVEEHAFDVEAAKALLDEAGWTDRDGDGVRENAEGLPLSISIMTHIGNQQRQDIAEIMQAQLREVGIEVTLTVIEFQALIQLITDPIERDYDGVVMGFVTEFAMDDTDLFHSAKLNEPYAWSGTKRPDIDRYLERLPFIVDQEEAKPLWSEYQRLLVDEAPYTFFYFPDKLVGLNKRLRNVIMDPRGQLQNIKDWWIPADRRRRRGR